MKSKYLSALTLFFLSTLYGCASIVSGQDQIVSVSTPNCPGADCKLVNPAGTYYVTSPGTVSVGREYDDLSVTCKLEGHDPVAISVSSSTKGMAFGNILLGGGIGAGVDMATGAAYDYPSEIINPLDCRTKAEVAKEPKSGNYDKEALALVDTKKCEAPGFVFLDGEDEIYRSQCLDGKVGVIACSAGKCRPVNVSAPLADGSDSISPKYAEAVKKIGEKQNCTESFRATDVSSSAETWMVKCPTGKYIVIKCSNGNCAQRM